MNIYGNVDGSSTKVGCFELWKRHLLNYLKRNQSKYPVTRDYNFYATDTCTLSGKDKVNFYYTIDGYPTKVPVDFKTSIRREALEGVRVSFISLFEPTVIEWNSPQMRSKIRTWKNIEEDKEEVTAYNYIENISSMDSMERRKASLIYLSDASVRRQRNLFRYRTLMVVSGERGDRFDKSIGRIESICSSMGFKVTRVSSNLFSFLSLFSPFSLSSNNDVIKEIGSNTIPDEQIARFSTYTQGKIGKEGIMFGTDIFSGFPVYKMFRRRSTDAENVLISAETGGGKSFFLKFILLQLLAKSEYVGTINDIEGFEYTPMAGFLANKDDVVLLNMAEGSGCYYDPFEIVLTGDSDLDDDLFNISKSFTSSYFSVLIGSHLLSTNDWVQKIINNAIAKAYSDLGVNEFDSSTWSRTSGKDLYFVYRKFRELYEEYFTLKKEVEQGKTLDLNDIYKVNEEYRDALDKVVSRLSEYFEPLSRGGIRNNVFQNRVSLSKIASAKLVINSFGMAGKSADVVDKTQMSLSQLSAANISHIRSIFSKSRGKYNFKVWEEFQRWGAFPDSVNTIKTAITGGRKLGDINFVVTNNIKELLDDDKFAIFDNTTSFAIGAIKYAETRKRVCQALSVEVLQPELDSLVTKKGSTESFESEDEITSMYDKAFLVHLDDSISTIAKVILPKYVTDSDIFKTGTKIKE